MKEIGIAEFKARCIRIFKDVQESQVPLVVTHRGRPIARIEPVPESRTRQFGALSDLGKVRGELIRFDFTSDWEMG